MVVVRVMKTMSDMNVDFFKNIFLAVLLSCFCHAHVAYYSVRTQ